MWLESKGDFSKSKKFLNNIINRNYESILRRYAEEGVSALSNATPVLTGKTAASWGYEIIQNKDTVSIQWYNTNIKDGVNIAIIIQYGHGTGTGGYVEGRDYINPAIQPVFDKLAENMWKEIADK